MFGSMAFVPAGGFYEKSIRESKRGALLVPLCFLLVFCFVRISFLSERELSVKQAERALAHSGTVF